MVDARRKAIESLYVDTCDIVEYQKVQKANKSVGFEEVVVCEQQPCRLSIDSTTQTASSNNAATVAQTVKLFIAPEINVKPGSKIIVTHCGRTTAYKNSGFSALRSQHQEINLELFDGWA